MELLSQDMHVSMTQEVHFKMKKVPILRLKVHSYLLLIQPFQKVHSISINPVCYSMHRVCEKVSGMTRFDSAQHSRVRPHPYTQLVSRLRIVTITTYSMSNSVQLVCTQKNSFWSKAGDSSFLAFQYGFIKMPNHYHIGSHISNCAV